MTQALAAPLSQALAQACAPDWEGTLGTARCNEMRGIVRTAFADTAACVLAGRSEPATQVVVRWAQANHPAGGAASILFGAARLPAADAAFVNGVAGHALDFDDVGLAGHPSVVLVPALWSEHETRGVRGLALVQAYAKGYAVWAELQRRMKVALHARGWHPTAVFGVVATAAAVAAARRLPPDRTAHALGIAASHASGLIANFGSMTKPLHIGRASQAGMHAVDLAEAGLDASADALDGRAGLLAALGGPGQADLGSGLPDDFALALITQRPGIKKYPVCYAVHRVVDGLLDLAGRHRFAASEVAAVDATISETTAGVLRHHQPASLTEARFSLEFTAAAALVRGALGLADVSDAVLADPQVRAVIPLVRTHTTRTSCPLEPSFAYEDRVTVTLRDGSVLDSGPIRFARGHAHLPLTDAQVRDKVLACVAPDEQPLAERVLARIDQALAP